MSGKKLTVLKRQRQEEKRKKRNKQEKSRIKTMVKNAKESILNQDVKSEEIIKRTLKNIDKAKAKNVIHKNTAARKKSRLTKYRNKYKVEKEVV